MGRNQYEPEESPQRYLERQRRGFDGVPFATARQKRFWRLLEAGIVTIIVCCVLYLVFRGGDDGSRAVYIDTPMVDSQPQPTCPEGYSGPEDVDGVVWRCALIAEGGR